MNSMDESVRQLVVSLGSSAEPLVTKESIQREAQPSDNTVISTTSSNITESERHAYQQKKNRIMHQEKQCRKNKSKDSPLPATNQEHQHTPKPKTKEKRKTICLGVEAQKM